MLLKRKGGQTPKPGHVSICVRCARIKQWDENMRLVPLDLSKLTPEERTELRLEQERIRSIGAGRHLVRRRGRR